MGTAIEQPLTTADYSNVTESPGGQASREQLARLFHRYRFAADYCRGKDVLEVACGTGQGLGYLKARARSVIGVDCTYSSLSAAQHHYRGRIPLLCADAQSLPFPGARFDAVVLLEAIYYLPSAEVFIREMHRLLRPGGVLVIGTVNKDWLDFHPSPLSVKYFSVPELATVLHKHGFEAEFFGGFLASDGSLRGKALSFAKRTAVKFHLIPDTMKQKEILKRIVFGRLAPLPAEIQECSETCPPPQSISSEFPNHQFKIIYAVGHRK